MYAGTEQAVGNMDADRHGAIIDAIEIGEPNIARKAEIDHMRWAAENLVTGAAQRFA